MRCAAPSAAEGWIDCHVNLDFAKVPAEELYDKTKDPDHVYDLASDPAFQNVLKDLQTKLDDYLKSHDDPRAKGLSPWDDYNLDKPFPLLGQ